MSETVMAYRSPPADARRVLISLSESAAGLSVLSSGGMRLEFVDADHCRLIIPAAPTHTTADEGVRRHKIAVDELMDAYSMAAEPFSKRAGARSVDLSVHPPVLLGALLLAYGCARMGEDEFDNLDGIAECVGRECLIVLYGQDVEEQLDQLARLVQRCPMARLSIENKREEPDELVTLLHLNDDVDRSSTLGGLVSRNEFDGARILARYNTSVGAVFMPRPLSIPRDVLYELGRVLEACTNEADLEPASAFGVFEGEEGLVGFQAVLPAADAREILGDDISAESVRWRFLDLSESKGAAESIREAIGRVDSKSGYRLTLHSTANWQRGDQSLQNIRERVVELEAQAALIRGLSAPQLRLLRFSRSQLPALANFLIRAPVTDIDRGVIQYGFQATAMEPEGVHFVLYDPAEVVLDSAFPEWEWRERTDDHPIRYWLDPHWAAHYAGGRSHVRSMVFTPFETALHPTLHSFSSDDMDKYLRQLMLRRVPEEEHTQALRALIQDQSRSTAILFDRTEEAGFEIAVEVLDLNQFVPVRQRLDWINDHLLMIDPAIVSQERISEVATLLFEGRTADALLEEAESRADEMCATAERTEHYFNKLLQGIMKRVDQEFTAVTEQATLSISYLEKISVRLSSLENLMEEGQRNFEGAARVAESLEDISSDQEIHREQLEDQIRTNYEETEHFVAAAEERLMKTRRELETLKSKLDGLRYGG